MRIDRSKAVAASVGVAIGAALGCAAGVSPALALAIAAAIPISIVVMTRADLVLLALVATLPWEGELAYPSETLTVTKALGLLLLLSYVAQVLLGRKRLRMPPTAVWAGLFLLIASASLVASDNPGEGFLKLGRYISFVGFFVVASQLVTSRDQVVTVVKVLALSAAIAGIVGVVPFIEGSQDRAYGPIPDVNDFAFMLGTVLPLAAYLYSRPSRWKPVWALCFAAIAVAMFATLSRGALLGLGAVLLWGLTTRRVPLRVPLAMAAIGLVAVLILSSTSPYLLEERLTSRSGTTSEAAETREALWDAALRMSQDRPVLGVGTGLFDSKRDDYVRSSPGRFGATEEGVETQLKTAHSAYLEILAESGILTLMAFVAFLIGTWRLLSRSRRLELARADRDGVRLASALQAALLFGLVSASFISMQVNISFWLIGALAAALAPALEAEPGSRPAPVARSALAAS